VAERDTQAVEPLVSVGIPTYNRAEKLKRAAESVLGQTHRNVELVISDNASGDDTESLCRELCRRDTRVRYLRAEFNRGPTANFNVLFDELRGEYAMVLSDDDWLDAGYLASCLSELRRAPTLALACGIAHYMRDGAAVREGVEMQLVEESPSQRMLTYLRDVDENGVFYGLMPRPILQRAAPLRNVLGNDWLLAAAIVAQGKVATIRSASINRELDGTSGDFHKLTTTLGLPRWQARIPHLVIAWQVLADVGWRAPVYRELPPMARARLVLAAPLAAIRWRSLAWHMTMPTFAALGRHRGGRWLWQLYARITRLAGGADPSVRSPD
jgi:glycosyltransferase involved in cell wall biosynthesis